MNRPPCSSRLLLRPTLLRRRDTGCRPSPHRPGWTDVDHVRDEVGVDFQSCNCGVKGDSGHASPTFLAGPTSFCYSSARSEGQLPCSCCWLPRTPATKGGPPLTTARSVRSREIAKHAGNRASGKNAMYDGMKNSTRRVLCCRNRRGADTSRVSDDAGATARRSTLGPGPHSARNRKTHVLAGGTTSRSCRRTPRVSPRNQLRATLASRPTPTRHRTYAPSRRSCRVVPPSYTKLRSSCRVHSFPA